MQDCAIVSGFESISQCLGLGYGEEYIPAGRGPRLNLKLSPSKPRTPIVFPWNPSQNPMNSVLPV